uniref:Uncharacterized protein n=1 Tax=Romanomermis culicivorax TaxID=13658 RepID=A0A915JCH5_ROMCU
SVVSGSDIARHLQTVYGNSGLGQTTVSKLIGHFREGWKSLEDDQRPRQPVTASSAENVAAVEDMVMEDHRVTVQEIVTELMNLRSVSTTRSSSKS